MTAKSRYVERLVGLPQALEILSLHPDGLPIRDLAAELGVKPETLRDTVLAYYRMDLAEYGSDLYRLPVVEFVSPEGQPDDPYEAEVLRVESPEPERELGVEYLSAGELAALYEAGRDLLELEPANEHLREALEALHSSLLPVDPERREALGSDAAQQLAHAVAQRRKVRIEYARAWHPGVSTRTIHPYRMVRTRRGWEVDAGPPDDRGRLRTYLVAGIHSVTLLDEEFERPDNVDNLIANNRAITQVELVVPQAARWVVDRFAEHVEVLDEDELSIKVRADLLPPLERRVGLILITAGPEAFVMTPGWLQDAGVALARELLMHHGLAG